MELTFCELREKVVFNVIDGKKLGRPIDMAFSLNGQVLGIIVPDEKRLLKCISADNNLFIPWNCIIKIGEDAILVQLQSNSCGLIDNDVDNCKNCR